MQVMPLLLCRGNTSGDFYSIVPRLLCNVTNAKFYLRFVASRGSPNFPSAGDSCGELKLN